MCAGATRGWLAPEDHDDHMHVEHEEWRDKGEEDPRRHRQQEGRPDRRLPVRTSHQEAPEEEFLSQAQGGGESSVAHKTERHASLGGPIRIGHGGVQHSREPVWQQGRHVFLSNPWGAGSFFSLTSFP